MVTEHDGVLAGICVRLLPWSLCVPMEERLTIYGLKDRMTRAEESQVWGSLDGHNVVKVNANPVSTSMCLMLGAAKVTSGFDASE